MNENHAEAFVELESDIADLVRAVDLAMLAASGSDPELTLHAVQHAQALATALRDKYYRLAVTVYPALVGAEHATQPLT